MCVSLASDSSETVEVVIIKLANFQYILCIYIYIAFSFTKQQTDRQTVIYKKRAKLCELILKCCAGFAKVVYECGVF